MYLKKSAKSNLKIILENVQNVQNVRIRIRRDSSIILLLDFFFFFFENRLKIFF